MKSIIGENRNSKKRILFSYANTAELGGADFCLYKLAASLDKNKFEVTVLFSQKCDLEEKYKQSDIDVLYIDMPRLQATKNPFKLLSYLFRGRTSIKKIQNIIDNRQIDIVHGNDLLDIWGSIAGKRQGIKCIQHIRMIISDGLVKQALLFLLPKINDVIIPVSNATANSYFSSQLNKVYVGYDWIDEDYLNSVRQSNSIDVRKELGISESALCLGIVGRIQRWKGQKEVIEAFSKISGSFQDSCLVICGGEVQGRHKGYFTEIAKFAETLGISNKVIFLGNRNDVNRILPIFDVFVHGSISPDPLPGVIMEASLAELPVLGPNSGGVPEEIVDNVTGFLYEERNVSDLASKMEMILNLSIDERKAIGKNGRSYVIKKFNKGKILEEFEDLYLSLN